MQIVTVIGIIASSFTAVSLLPQLLKIIRERKSDTLSYGTIGALFGGLAFWIYYGVVKEDLIIIASNFISLFINTIFFFLSIKYKRDERF